VHSILSLRLEITVLFGETRAAFLEFLRNLTPQILLFSIALIMATRLDLRSFSFAPDDVVRALPFSLVMFMFLAAVTANTSLFIEKAATSAKWADAKSIELREQGIRGAELQAKLLKALWKENKKAFAEVLLLLLIVQVGLVAVLLMSIPTAANLLQQINMQA
jgi:hypothetical protein